MWSVDVPDASSDRFKTLWFDDDLNGKIRKSAGDVTPGMGGPNDLYEASTVTSVQEANIQKVWMLLHD